MKALPTGSNVGDGGPDTTIRARPTIDDVAALAGVGRATVSRVLNDQANVRPRMRERVLSAVAELDYRVNPQARGLASKVSKSLVLVHCSNPDAVPNSYYSSALELGALRAAMVAGFDVSTLSLVVGDPHCSDKVIDLFTSGRSAGVILTPPLSDDVALARELLDRGFPVVCVSPGEQVRKLLPGVGLDEESAGHEMGAHVVALGHRRFGYILGIEGHRSAEDRYAGFIRALAEAGIGADAVSSVRGDFTFRAGVLGAEQLLGIKPRPSAIVCGNDDMAVGAMFAAHRINLALPAELSVVGFDDAPISAHIWPPLTTIHQPIRSIAARAVERLVETVRRGTPPESPAFETIDYQLVVRESAVAPATHS